MATSAPTAPAAPRQLHFALLFMRPNADNLRLVGCTANAGGGDYLCGFTHGVPPATHLAGTGHAHFTVEVDEQPPGATGDAGQQPGRGDGACMSR